MAARYPINGYGQLEINNCAFRRDGRIEAQTPLCSTGFATAGLENGMIVAVDKLGNKIKLIGQSNADPIGIAFTSEHVTGFSHGLKDFICKRGGAYPRIGYLSVGDIFTTNTVSHAFVDTDNEVDHAAFVTALGSLGTTALYGKPSADGSIEITSNAPQSGLKLKVLEKTTMPDGQLGVKFQVHAV